MQVTAKKLGRFFNPLLKWVKEPGFKNLKNLGSIPSSDRTPIFQLFKFNYSYKPSMDTIIFKIQNYSNVCLTLLVTALAGVVTEVTTYFLRFLYYR